MQAYNRMFYITHQYNDLLNGPVQLKEPSLPHNFEGVFVLCHTLNLV